MNVADWPTFTRPMSVSSTNASTCNLDRSMMVTNVGAVRPAAMVSPSWVETEAITPSMGETIRVYETWVSA